MLTVLLAASIITVLGVLFVVDERTGWRDRFHTVPLSRVATCRPGHVKLQGTVRAIGASLEAPVSKARCVAYQVIGIDARDREQTRTTQWVEFALDDGTGTASVPIKSDLLQDLELFAMTETTGTEGPILRREQRLCEGDFIVVLGKCRRSPDPSPHEVSDYRRLPTRLELFGTSAFPLAMTLDRKAA